MKEKVYDFNLGLSWEVLRAISKIDRFDRKRIDNETRKRGRNKLFCK
ncbi:MAG: hypothetical protein ACJAVP_003582 [Spirosomataceae bacterium]|jgi:hypothetical protein